MSNSREFAAGLKDGIPICLGYLAVSFAFGIQAVLSGLTVFEASAISLLNVTSAGQFAGLGVMTGGGTYIEMAAVQLVINLRYALMSAAISQKLDSSVGTGHRMGIAYGMTDEIFGISAARKGRLSPFYSYGAILISVFGWVLGTFLGAYSGQILPDRLISALGVALYGMFVAIVVPVAMEDKKILMAVLAGVILSTLFYYLPVLRDISAGMRIIIVTVIVAGAAAVIFPDIPGEKKE